jgi:predicted nucleotidyltransferase
MLKAPRLQAVIAEQPYPLLFVTVSGAHLYGFSSADSDYDLRGVHVLPALELLGMVTGPKTLQTMGLRDGLEIDLVTHEVRKYFRLLLRNNGYVLEQIFSPLVLATTPEHAESKAIARGCITRHHWKHYAGFANNEWRQFTGKRRNRVKALLYIYRVLLTGIHLMRTGEVEANLVTLKEVYRLPQVPDLIARKLAGPEQGTLGDADLPFHERERDRLAALLRAAGEHSSLPEAPTTAPALNELLLRLRFGTMPGG